MCILSFIYWIFSLFTFQMLYLFRITSPPLRILLSPPTSFCFYEGVPAPHSFTSPHFHIPFYWSIVPSQDKGPLLPLMHKKAILCYIFVGSHRSLNVYSLVDGLFHGSTGGSASLHCSMWLQSPSVPPVLLPAHPPRALSRVWWLALSIHICIGLVLAKPPREQSHQVPLSKHQLATATV